ncbi:MAG TPA: Wzz/FepE/Etk N-terminal domain-containing protein [Bacteroidales bacterium]|nr:Wzz/FepE/Etk N-terminal domain-containing protein [Bacteroidales bacterium]HPT12454.1 Wzz/FepE/Etk N-terminal domain-containing protein [Bacteroidales bacterium]
MKKNPRVDFKPDSVDLVNFVLKYIKIFIITGLAAAVLSALISYAFRPLFESKVILYPSSNIVETHNLLGQISSSSSVFGDDDATERLIQILKSEQVKEYLKKKYDLKAHYNIKPDAKYPNTAIEQKMKKYIHCSKTSYGSVEVTVRDRDRNIACLMANDMTSRADTIFNAIQREASSKICLEIQKSYESQLKVVHNYQDSLRQLAGYGGFDSENGEGSIYKAYFEAMADNNKPVADKLEKKLDLYQKDRPEFLRIYSTLEKENEYLLNIRGRYLEALSLARQNLPYTLIIDKAIVAEKKVWPKRSYIVVIATFSSLLLMALLLFISDSVVMHSGQDGRE